MKINDVVKFKNPCNDGEGSLIFTVTNVNEVTNRCYIACINSGMGIMPEELVNISDVEEMPDEQKISSLAFWVSETEETHKYRNFYRCYTDKFHGFYFDLFKDKAVTMNGDVLTATPQEISGLNSDFKHGEDN